MPKTGSPRKPRKKQPVTATVGVIIDDGPVEVLEDARTALSDAETEARASRERRVLQTQLQITDDPPDRARLRAEIAVDEADDTALEPFRQAVTDAESQVRAATDTYRFRSIGRHAFADLVREHPATDEDHETARGEVGGDQTVTAPYHADSFAPALIAACCVDPVLTVDEAKVLWAEWNEAEALEMFLTALSVNKLRRTADLGKDSGPTRSAVR